MQWYARQATVEQLTDATCIKIIYVDISQKIVIHMMSSIKKHMKLVMFPSQNQIYELCSMISLITLKT